MNILPEPSYFSIFKRLLKEHIRPYLRSLFWAILLMVIIASCTALQAWLMQPALDMLFVKRQANMLYIVPTAVVLVALVKGIASYSQSILMRTLGQRIITSLQLRLYRHLLYADLSFLSSFHSGKLLSRFTNDITLMRNAVSGTLTGIAKEFLSIIFLVGVMCYQSLELSAIALLVLLTGVLPLSKLGKRMRQVAYATQDQLGHFTSQLDETLRSVRVVKAYHQEETEVKRATSQIESLLTLYFRASKIGAFTSPLLETLSGVAVALIIAYGGVQILNEHTTPGRFFSFIAALIMAYKPIKSLADMNTNLQEGLTAASRLFELLDTHPTIADAPNALALSQVKGEITFNQVTFGYSDSETSPILDNISLTIPAGQTIAFVGPSGGGKSTILNLLLRFYDPTQGEVLLDGHPLSQIALASLREHISFVGQEVMLFDDTVRANILYGRPQASEEEVIKAAKAAAAHEFIMELPQQYDTPIGQQGNRLSGGQRQRLAIARALLRNSPILLLDEATSALDSITEQQIQHSLQQLRHHQTTIIIAHRLSTIQHADCIYVIRHGKIMEHGSHKDLLAKKGAYWLLHSRQQDHDS